MNSQILRARPLPFLLLALTTLAGLGACSDTDVPGEPDQGGRGSISPGVGSTAPGAGEEIWFEEQASQRGLDFRHVSGYRGRAMLPEIVGGGAALADVDGDGDLDAYFVQGGYHLAQPSGSSTDRLGNRLYLNRGDGHFTPSDSSGAEDRGYGMGVAAADYDGDGDIDLFVTNVGPNVLLQNDGTGQFTNVAAIAGVDDPGWGTAALFHDLDNDGDLDLFVVNYLNWSVAIEKDCFNRGNSTYCAPTAYNAPAMDRLYRNDGNGTFSDVTAAAGMNRGFGNGLGAVADDFNGDGLLDIFVANDRTLDQLWINKGGMVFADEADLWGCAVDDNGIAKAGMGVAARDIDHDLDPDLLVVNFETETDSLYLNQGRYFVDATAQAGIAVASRRRTRFGVALEDFDNDGVVDLYEVNGKVDGDPASVEDVFAEPNALFKGSLQEGKVRFSEIRPYGGVAPAAPQTSRALVVGDVDDDGGLDLLIVNRDGAVHLLMNRVARGHWVRLRLSDPSGAATLGASVRGLVNGTPRQQRVRQGYSYLASHDPRVHFGLGTSTVMEQVRVTWPDGSTETFGSYGPESRAELVKGAGQPVR